MQTNEERKIRIKILLELFDSDNEYQEFYPIIQDADKLLDDSNFENYEVFEMKTRAETYLESNNRGDEKSRIARFVRNKCNNLLGLPSNRRLERNNDYIEGEFYGKRKRNSPKYKSTCKAVHRTWVKKSNSKKGFCRKSHNKK